MGQTRDITNEEDVLYEIRRVAYDLYEKSGRKPGSEFESWFEAAMIVKSRTQEDPKRESPYF